MHAHPLALAAKLGQRAEVDVNRRQVVNESHACVASFIKPCAMLPRRSTCVRHLGEALRRDADVKRTDFRAVSRLRVRWAEVDMQKIVFNAHYLTYFDTAVADYWRALGLPYQAAMQRLGGDLYVRKASVEYHASACADDTLEVGLRCARVGTTSLTFEGGVFRGEQFLVGAELVYVFADPSTRTSKPVPDALRALLQDYEAGQPVVRVAVGDWARLGEAAAAVRTEVFVEEQGIAREDEYDAADATAVHAVVFNRLDQPLATGRLLQHADGGKHTGRVGRIGRMAVLRSMRSSGQGARVLHALLAAAWARGDTEVLLNAQRSAEGFYRRLGFTARGEPFDEVGIPHVQMAITPHQAQQNASNPSHSAQPPEHTRFGNTASAAPDHP